MLYHRWRVRRMCSCRLSGRAHYARRCPRCGLARYTSSPEYFARPAPPEVERWAEQRRRAQLDAAAEARQALARLAAAAERSEWPQRPVAARPRRPLTPREERRWAEKARLWEACRWAEIREELRRPIEEAADVCCCRARYARRARELIAVYRARAAAAGWEL